MILSVHVVELLVALADNRHTELVGLECHSTLFVVFIGEEDLVLRLMA